LDIDKKVALVLDQGIKKVLRKLHSARYKAKFSELIKALELKEKLSNKERQTEATKIFWQLIGELRQEELPE
jgi:hypothetical protein